MTGQVGICPTDQEAANLLAELDADPDFDLQALEEEAIASGKLILVGTGDEDPNGNHVEGANTIVAITDRGEAAIVTIDTDYNGKFRGLDGNGKSVRRGTTAKERAVHELGGHSRDYIYGGRRGFRTAPEQNSLDAENEYRQRRFDRENVDPEDRFIRTEH